jgi:hypothetical protein
MADRLIHIAESHTKAHAWRVHTLRPLTSSVPNTGPLILPAEISSDGLPIQQIRHSTPGWMTLDRAMMAKKKPGRGPDGSH